MRYVYFVCTFLFALILSACSNHAEGLKRIQIGELTLPEDLKAGEWRWLSDADITKLGS